MKISEGVEWAVHCLLLLAVVPEERPLSAARLAEFHGVPAPYLAKHLQSLSRAGLVDTVPGPGGGYRLARPAAAVSVLDVLLAIEGPGPAFSCAEIRRNGPAGLDDGCYLSVCAVNRTMGRAEAAYRAVLAETSVASLVDVMMADAHPEGLRRGAEWLGQVLA